MPRELAKAYDVWAARTDEVDALQIWAAEPPDYRAMAQELLGRPADREMEALLGHLPRLTFYPREIRDRDGEPSWRSVFAEGAPERAYPSEVTVADAWFRRDLSAGHFLPGQPVALWHLPAVRVRARFDLPIRPDVVDGWRDGEGELDGARFRAWDEREADLVGWMDWDLGAALQRALPDVLFALMGFRTGLAEEASR